MAPKIVWCSCMKSWRASFVTSHTVSLMSCRSPLIRVIGSMDNIEALIFFHNPARSTRCWRFNCVDVVRKSVPPSSVSASSAACPCEGIAWPSPAFMVAACVAVVATAFSCSAALCATSRADRTSAVSVSFLHFSANCAMHSLASPFFFCAAEFLISAMFGTHHSGDRASKTLKMASSVATKGSFVHYFVGSLRALIYMLCMSALNSVKHCRLL